MEITRRVVEIRRTPRQDRPRTEDERDPRVDMIAAMVRELYMACAREVTGSPTYGTREIPRWDGGEDRFGTQHQPVWPRIARFMLQHRVHPLYFIRAQFWSTKPGRRMPMPNQFYNDQALENYHRFLATRTPEALRAIAESEKRAVYGVATPFVETLGWDWKKAIRYALGDLAAIGVSALTRFCVAAQTELPDVAERCRDRALLQYLWESDVYNAVWGDQIPEDFRQEAEELRALLLSS